ncbi:MAG TPA: hypothetical protein VHC45_16655, partial [Gaiellaceae bacterium]|nr:hypothetical protein [Gaiellaceae bacterium]
EAKPGKERTLDWRRWRPRPPQRPGGGGRFGGSQLRSARPVRCSSRRTAATSHRALQHDEQR